MYPLIIWVLGKLHPFKYAGGSVTPTISIIISAFNEEKNIIQKIENTLALEYPKDKMEILIGSDGSTDSTAEKIKQYKGNKVLFFDCKANRGKTAVQNDLVEKSEGEILIFTDASSFLKADSIKALVSHFADDKIGCVAGKMRFVDLEKNITTQSQGLYWRYEIFIRKMEARLGSLIGVDGPLYAIRSDCYVPLASNMISDLMAPLLVLEKGKKVVWDQNAIVDEEPTTQTTQEFKTRRRITLRGMVALWEHRHILNPFKQPFLSFQIFSHKIIRWFVGMLVIMNGIACIPFASNWLFRLYLLLYALFFVAAAMGWMVEKTGIKFKPLTVPYYFCLVNFAATMGIIDFLRKKQAISWTPVRE